MLPARRPSEPLRVLVAEGDADARLLVASRLAALGHGVVAQVGTSVEAVAEFARLAPDVVLLAVKLADGPAVAAARQMAAARPETAVVFITGDPDTPLADDEMMGTAAMAFILNSTSGAHLDAAVRLAAARARDLAAARESAADARRQLEDRKTIERAKGILMRRTGASEQEAYRILQRTSQDRGVPMAKIARAVLDSEPGAAPRTAEPGAAPLPG